MFLKLFSKTKPPDDQELVQQYQRTGDPDCIGKLFERHTEMVYLVCLKYLRDEEDSKDATMQVFENIVESLKRHEVTNFKSWLHSIAKNHCLMQLRTQQTRARKTLAEELKVPEPEQNLPLQLSDADHHELELQALEQGLMHLPEDQRTCLELFYLQQKSYQEIAGLTGYSLNQVKSYIQNGKRNLKIYVQRNHAK